MFESVEAPKLADRKIRTKKVKPMGIRIEKLTALLDAEIAMNSAFDKMSDKEKQIYNENSKKEVAVSRGIVGNNRVTAAAKHAKLAMSHAKSAVKHHNLSNGQEGTFQSDIHGGLAEHHAKNALSHNGLYEAHTGKRLKEFPSHDMKHIVNNQRWNPVPYEKGHEEYQKL